MAHTGPEKLGWSVTSAGGLHSSLVPPWAWPWAVVFLTSFFGRLGEKSASGPAILTDLRL